MTNTDKATERHTFDHLASLVQRFSNAILLKLRAAEEKYGYNNGWLKDDWASDLRRQLLDHIDKGDPRDVAAYCAFAWHHGWSVSSPIGNFKNAAVFYQEKADRLQRELNSLPVALKALEEAKEYLDALAASEYVTDPVELDALLRRIDGLLIPTTIKDSANG